jgi:hypothetical protein
MTSDDQKRPRFKLCFRLPERCATSLAIPPSPRGALCIVTNVEAGCDGRVGVAGRAILMRTAKACGPGTPGLVSSLR